jgi:hypothetical protein
VTTTPTATPTTSTINFPLGETRANGTVAPLDVDGDVSAVYKAGGTNTTHLILDISGCFV